MQQEGAQVAEPRATGAGEAPRWRDAARQVVVRQPQEGEAAQTLLTAPC